MTVCGVGDDQQGPAFAPVNGCTDVVDVESQPEHSVRLIELDVFRQNGAFLSGNAYAKMQLVRKARLVR